LVGSKVDMSGRVILRAAWSAFHGLCQARMPAPRLDEALLLKELANTRREVRNLTVMGMRPDLTAKEREIVPLLERSARAEVKLRIKALRYCRSSRAKGSDERRLA
jgi:hypothetical protein